MSENDPLLLDALRPPGLSTRATRYLALNNTTRTRWRITDPLGFDMLLREKGFEPNTLAFEIERLHRVLAGGAAR